ncbi:hypothetical protein [Deinococcus budaensis]|uniref:Uncharacterized protein n=1 Tax=Deinococcus budaensis TaxID=1665626 RepID=A0A7W8GFB6_9DEIO|nr:hypothetical protein [Deinococcus budaensis]MBB5234596.1 hypothetical protein [Deinococcus budaensis]
MDINQARFLFEVQRVGDRVAAECRYIPGRPRSTPRPAGSVRHALALWLHHLATRLDVPEPQPV